MRARERRVLSTSWRSAARPDAPPAARSCRVWRRFWRARPRVKRRREYASSELLPEQLRPAVTAIARGSQAERDCESPAWLSAAGGQQIGGAWPRSPGPGRFIASPPSGDYPTINDSATGSCTYRRRRRAASVAPATVAAGLRERDATNRAVEMTAIDAGLRRCIVGRYLFVSITGGFHAWFCRHHG